MSLISKEPATPVCASLSGTTNFRLELPGFIVQEDVYGPHDSCDLHVHDCCRISYVLQGSYTETSCSGSYSFVPGVVSLHPEGESHSKRFEAEGARILTLTVVRLGKQLLSAHRLNLQNRRNIHGVAAQRTALKLLREARNWKRSTSLGLNGIVLELLSHFVCPDVEGRTVSQKHWPVRVKELLDHSYLHPFSLTELASLVDVHPTHLARTFRRTYGCTVGEYVRDLKIQRACVDLTETQQSITEIALRCGFADHSHFSRMFRQRVGISPSNYRKGVFCIAAQRLSA